jgi:hypothetical protein
MSRRLRLRLVWVGGISLAVIAITVGFRLAGARSRSALYLFPWHYNWVAVGVRGHAYRVTHRTVSQVGPLVTGVMYHGALYSGWYAVYSIPGVPVSQEVAVRARQGYLLAVRVPAP